MSRRFAIHGLAVQSDVPIEAPSLPDTGTADVRVQHGGPDRPALAGEVICEIELPAGLGTYVGTALNDGYALTFEAFAFHVSHDLGLVRWWADGEEDDAVGHMVSGNVLAFLLQLREVALLHASVVVTPAGTLAFAGHSGAGKSTLAALFCESGAQLLTDDVVRLDVTGDKVTAYPGGTALRLRPAAEVVGARMSGSERFRAQDGRLGVRPALVTTPQELDHVLLPFIRPEVQTLALRRLPPREALVALLSVPRWFGWRIPAPTRAQFRAVSALSERVPVSELRLPPHDEPSPQIVSGILERLG